jgi:hypothetical protein
MQKKLAFFAWLLIVGSLISMSPLAHAVSNDDLAKQLARPNSWTLWPKDSASVVSDVQEGDDHIVSMKGDHAATIYQWVPLEPNKLYRVMFDYKAPRQSEQASGSVKLSFRAKDAADKVLPAGDKNYSLQLQNGSQDWREFSQVLVVPDAANQPTQFVISHNPEAGGLLLKNIRVFKEEPVAVPQSQPLGEAPLSPEAPFWSNAASVRDFWNVENKGELSDFPTEVKLAYDSQALYVQFVNHERHPEKLKKSQTERDGSIWNDDSDEIYIALSNEKAFQFITGAGGGQWDGRLIQKVPGDPYRADKAWNGDWQSQVKIGGDRWWSAWRIPFETLGEKPSPQSAWRINFARHRYADGSRESSRWSYADGETNAIDHFGYLRFGENSAELERFVGAISLHPLKVERPDKQYLQVLGKQPGGYHTEDWGHDFYLSYYPPSFQEKYTKESWREEYIKKIWERGENGTYGPTLPAAYNTVGWEPLLEAHAKYGIKFPYSMTTSGNDAIALKNGARYYDETPQGVASGRVVDFDPAKLESIFSVFDRFLSQPVNKENLKKLIAFFSVVDEPTNTMFGAFSRSRRTNATAILDEVDAKIRVEYGAGRYGLYDHFGAQKENSPYERIAFIRWWNAQMADWGKQVRQGLNERMPGVPIQLSNQNTVGNIPFVDVPLLSQDSDIVSVDPYPTAVLALHGRARALYHTGFATKWMHDLAGEKEMTTIAQGFIYHGMAPSPDDAREWASQALKNGAHTLSWYAEGPASITIPNTWNEINAINKQVGKMNAIAFPSTKTTVFHSLISQAGLNDEALHGAYSVYSLLGERMGSWFEFSGERDGKAQDLSKYNLIYVPSASYLTKETAQALLKRTQEGATIVFFDPLSLSTSELGDSLDSIRGELIGGTLGKQCEASALSVKGGVIAEFPQSAQLPLTPVAQGIHRGKILAYDITAPADAQVFATYEDSKPAGYSRKVGQGRVIYFAAQPFGNSELAIKDSPWEDFMRALAKEIGEPTGLPIWQFYLEK